MTDYEIDRISDLPDGVLEHILSFLRTKQAVQTSVISKRWKNLWVFSPCIDFNYNEFRFSENFLGFGDMVLCRHETSYLHNFSIKCHYIFSDELHSDHLRRWINSAMKFKPRACCIEACIADFDLIANTFTCESIEEMSLEVHKSRSSMNSFDIIPTTVNLPHIKRLCLNRSYLNEETSMRLLTGCPVLEDLTLKICSGEFSSVFTREKLICLSLIDCYRKYEGDPLYLSETIPKSVDLPCIRRLHVTKFKIYEESSARLLAGCPLLEKLSLKDCIGKFSSIFRQKIICLSLIDCYCNYIGDPLVLSETLPKNVDLPCIRRLHIRKLYIDERSFDKLLTGCPHLEYLSLENCSGKFPNLFRNNIKCLYIRDCKMETMGDKVWWYVDKAIVKFNYPRAAEVLLVCTLHPLQLKFILNPPTGSLDCDNNFEPTIIFSGAECLKLCFPDTKVDWKKGLRRFQAFNNLKSLCLTLNDWCMHPHEIDPVVWFLQRSPNIEELTLYNPKRVIVVSRRGKLKPVALCNESTYYDSLLIELSAFKNLKRVEIKLCKNLFGDHSFKEAILRKRKDLVNVKVVLSEFDE